MRKVFLSFVLIVFLVSACASLKPNPKPWTKEEKISACYFIIAHAANAHSTERHQDSPELHFETNPILSKHPSDKKIITYFSITGAVAILLSHFWPNLRLNFLIPYGMINTFYTFKDLNSVKNQEK